jgi:antitoxin HicB
MTAPAIYKIPLTLEAQPEGGFTITSPLLPELITEGDSVAEALDNVRDALAAVIELYDDLSRPLPAEVKQDAHGGTIRFEFLVPAA